MNLYRRICREMQSTYVPGVILTAWALERVQSPVCIVVTVAWPRNSVRAFVLAVCFTFHGLGRIWLPVCSFQSIQFLKVLPYANGHSSVISFFILLPSGCRSITALALFVAPPYAVVRVQIKLFSVSSHYLLYTNRVL